MRRGLLLALIACLAIPGAVAGATRATPKQKTYTSGTISVPIPDAGTLEQPISVPDRGEVVSVQVFVRLEHSNPAYLTLSLVSPTGRVIRLSDRQGVAGTGYGDGTKNCAGTPTTFDDKAYTEIASGSPPFAGHFRPDQALSGLKKMRTDGVWKLRVTAHSVGAVARLYCWGVVLNRYPETLETARSRSTLAQLSYIFRQDSYSLAYVRLTVFRAGVVRLDTLITNSCRYCVALPSGAYSGRGSLRVRDFDRDGEPEVLVDLYTGGAHCCFYSLIYRYAGGRYVRLNHFWGDPGYRLADLNRDGKPEFWSADDRFAYAFSCFACSGLPVQIWDYKSGRMLDVTRLYPALVRADARQWWSASVYARKVHGDYSGLLAAWLADQYLLGHGAQGWTQVRAAVARPEFKRWWKPARYLRTLKSFLRRTGYSH
jgi:subtilisin-like proprotein convertase family protein